MSWQAPEGMDEYLKATELCDCDNVDLERMAKEIIKGAETPKEAALKIFYFVRDEIPWMSRIQSDVKASIIVEKRKGQCCNKTNLQVALLRAVGIPARHHQVKVKKEWHKGVIPSSGYNRLPEILPFCSYCECYLSEKWVACESCLDKALYEAMLKEGLVTPEQIPTIDWDGEKDLVVRTPWVTESVGTFASFDDGLRGARKEVERLIPRVYRPLTGFFFARINRQVDALRKGKK